MIGRFAFLFFMLTFQAQALDKLPDGEVTKKGGITAYLIDPTTRYSHSVLGDAIEAGGFAIEENGKTLTFSLPPEAVFEDLRVRLEDLDGDGRPEAIIVKSYLDKGAAIAVYKIGKDKIEPLAESPAIGQKNRWLNPVGVADFTGSGQAMIAAVITPHLVGSLRLYRLQNKALVEVARMDGYTNHAIGSRFLDSAFIKHIPNELPVIMITKQKGLSVVAIRFKGGKGREIIID